MREISISVLYKCIRILCIRTIKILYLYSCEKTSYRKKLHTNQIFNWRKTRRKKIGCQETNVSIKLTDLQACRSRSKVKKNRANSSATLPLYKRGKKREGRPPTSTAQWATNAWRQEQQIYGRLIARCRWKSRLSALLLRGEVFHCRKLVSLVELINNWTTESGPIGGRSFY